MAVQRTVPIIATRAAVVATRIVAMLFVTTLAEVLLALVIAAFMTTVLL